MFADERISSKQVAASLLAFARSAAASGLDGPGPFRAARDLLLRRPPRLRSPRPLRNDDEDVVEAAIRIARDLDHGVLPIQGPPGTGKTFTGARMIADLARAGKRIGVSSRGGIAAIASSTIRRRGTDRSDPGVLPPSLRAPPVKRRIVLRGVNFDFNSAEIRPDARPVLDQAAELLKENPEVDVRVEGHTDSVGSVEYNQALSLRRAEAVYRYLVNRGVDPERFTVEGLGKSRPIANNDTEAGRAQNRRVELIPKP